MGEYADYIINGDDCQECGVYIGPGDGYPRSCASCRRESAQFHKGRHGKVPCPVCGKTVTVVGLKDHQRDAHKVPKP